MNTRLVLTFMSIADKVTARMGGLYIRSTSYWPGKILRSDETGNDSEKACSKREPEENHDDCRQNECVAIIQRKRKPAQVRVPQNMIPQRLRPLYHYMQAVAVSAND